MYEDSLRETKRGDEILSYTSMQKFTQVMPKSFEREYIKRRIKNGVRLKVIAVDSPETREWKQNAKKEKRDIILIPPEKESFNVDFEIYANKVMIISYQENFMGVIIESEDIARMQRLAFKMMWEGAKKLKK